MQLGRTPELKESKAIPNCMVAVLTGGSDKPYVLGLTAELLSRGIGIDLIGSDELDCPELSNRDGLNFLNLRGDQRSNADISTKMARVLRYYWKLLRYAASAKPKIFHILWNNKFQFFDRTFLMLYYKLLGKKIVFTAHNVNAGKRDASDSLLNRITLRVQYHFCDHIFVHTEKMKCELLEEFGVQNDRISVIPFGINNSVPHTDLTPAEAKQRLGIGGNEKAILFFGAIRPYKGLEHLVDAFLRLTAAHPEYRLIIAGQPRKESQKYLDEIQRTIDGHINRTQVIQKIQFIPDEETELYFKAADVLALTYTHIFQSGVLFLAHCFGLPVVAADIGSFRDDVIEGRTGFLYDASDVGALARTIEMYFASDLYKELDTRRDDIRDLAERTHSWESVGQTTRGVYEKLLAQ